MRDNIRANRKKHSKHCSTRNLPVIERVTNMWWNPINAIRHQTESKLAAKEAAKEEKRERERQLLIEANRGKKARENSINLARDPNHTSYWAEGYGKGGNTAWRFECSCLEVCSSYENWRFHPVGRQFQCSVCAKWAHVSCVLGAHVTDDELEAMQDVMCHRCSASRRREQKRARFGDDDAPTVSASEAAAADEENAAERTLPKRVDRRDEIIWAGTGGSAMGAFDSLPTDDTEEGT